MWHCAVGATAWLYWVVLPCKAILVPLPSCRCGNKARPVTFLLTTKDAEGLFMEVQAVCIWRVLDVLFQYAS